MVVTLLGQLAPGWCREAAAKRALAYILDPIASPYIALAFTDFLRQTGLPRFTLSRVESDPDQPDDPGPDVTICDAEGKPRVFVQMTFFGAVNDAQPATYLRQLPVDAPSALVFLAPGYRIPGLWRDLKTNCSNAGIRVRDESPGVRMVWARARGRILVLGCWMHVLNSIDWVASVVGLERSIPQFRGLLDRMEREALHPLHEGEVADAAPTRRMIGHGPLGDATSYRSLLGYLIPLMRQPEPAATQALHYFLERSPTVASEFVAMLTGERFEIGRIRTEWQFGNGARPNLTIYDSHGNVRLSVENKFRAPLTDQHPVAYLEALPRTGRSVLAFIAPADRSVSLWTELKKRCERANLALADETRTNDLHRLRVGERTLVLTSWRHVLDTFRPVAGVMDGDIDQFRGFTERMNTDAMCS